MNNEDVCLFPAVFNECSREGLNFCTNGWGVRAKYENYIKNVLTVGEMVKFGDQSLILKSYKEYPVKEKGHGGSVNFSYCLNF